MQSSTRRPSIIGYSLILPGAWIAIGTLVLLIAPGHRLGIPGTALMFMAVAAFVAWLFARRHHRELSSTEYWKLIAYCTGWAASLELFVLLAVVVLPQMEAGHVDAGPLLFAVPFTLVLDFLFAWLAFRQTGRRVIAWYLKNSGRKPNTESCVRPERSGAVNPPVGEQSRSGPESTPQPPPD